MGAMTKRLCCCARRWAAQAAGEFIFLPHAGAWVFTDDTAVRSMSPRARYFAFSERSEFKHEDHSGEPVKFYVCVWCGGDLPSVVLDAVREVEGLTDPEA